MNIRELKIIILFLALGILLLALSGCAITTPEIKGVVLDAETKKPVAGAWVVATAEVKVVGLADKSYPVFLVGKVWTDEQGRFSLPSTNFDRPPFPLALSTTIQSLDISSMVVNAQGIFKFDQTAIKEPTNRMELTTYLKPPKKEEEYFVIIRDIKHYLDVGRVRHSMPPVSEVDRQEILDLAIGACEAYLKMYTNRKTVDERVHYYGVMKFLGSFYRKKENYEKALDVLMKLKDLYKDRFDLWEEEKQIKELQQLIQNRREIK